MSKQHRSNRSSQKSIIEMLEARRYQSVTTINGTSGNDSFIIKPLKAGDSVVYNGNGGSDTISVSQYGNHPDVLGTVQLKNSNGGKWTFTMGEEGASHHALVIGNGKIVGAVPGTIDYSATTLASFDMQLEGSSGSTAKITDLPSSVVSSGILLSGDFGVTLGSSAAKTDEIKGAINLSFADAGSSVVIDDTGDTARSHCFAARRRD